MSENTLLSEDEVKTQLGISDFRSINKKQLIEFVSTIPKMDKQVAIKCIEQFPKFKEYSTTIVNHFQDLCNNALENDNDEDLKGYQSILDSLKSLLEKDSLSETERTFIIEEMVIVGEHLENAVENHHKFKEFVVKAGAAVAAFGLAIGGAILGAKVGIDPRKLKS